MNRLSDDVEDDDLSSDERKSNRTDAEETIGDRAINKPDGKYSANREADGVVKNGPDDDRRHPSPGNEKGAKRYTDSSEKYSRDVEPLASDKTKAVVQQTEIDLATEELSNESNQSELFLIDLDTVIGENSNLLHTLTQHESIDNALNLATKIDFINSAVEIKTMTDESSAPSTQSHNEKLKENTEEPIKSDFDLEEQNDKYIPEYAEYDRKSNSLKQDTKSGTAIREGQSENPQATVSNKNRNLSDELFTLDNQSLSQHATKDAGKGNDLLKEITLGFFEARKGYLKSKKKSSSVVKQENLNKMMKRFFSSSQPGQHQISSCSTVTSHPPDTSLTCTQGKPDIEKDIEDNVRPLKIEELDSHKGGSTLHLSRHLDICLEQVSSSRRTLDLHQSGTLIGSASRQVETGEEDHVIAETETTVIAQKYENNESEDGKYNKNHNKENEANRDLICEFDDTETEADSDVFDIDLLRLDRTENGHRQLSNEQTRPSKNENTNFQGKQKCRTDEIVPDSNSDSEDDDEPDKMWLNFQFGKYAMVQDKGSRDSTIGGQAETPRNASTKHTTMHCNATSNTSPKGDEQTDSHSTFLQNINDSPNRSEAQKTCVTDTPVPFKERNALTSRLSLSKQFSSMKGIKPMSSGSSFKTNKCTATDDVNDNRSSPVQDDENDVLIPETPSHVRRQTNSVLTFDKDVNSINLSKRKESVDFAGESDQSTKARKETVAIKMKEGEIIRRVSGVIHDLKAAFNAKAVRKDTRISALRQELSSLEEKTTIPKTVIAVVGDTGSGKSSILNALLGHRSVLPTSGIRACTAVVVEIEDNPKNNMFEADIEFLTEQEWDQELDILMKDLIDWKGKFRKSPPKADSDTYISYKKVLAVYGKVDTKENLDQITDVTRCLGKTETISCEDPVTFRKEVEQYISQPQKADGDVVGEFWPIVKLVRFRLPHCAILSSGAVLVDLPGLRDYNLAREKVTKEYLKNCSSVWIVSSIHRAIDDKTAKTLLNESFQRQMFMDGRYGNVTFICSKTDDLKPSEIIRDLKLEPITHSLEQELSVAEEQKSHIEQKLESCQEAKQCESSGGTTRDNSSEIQNISKRISELKLQINMNRRKLYGICAKERNKYAKTQIKEDFAAGYKKLKRDRERGDQEEYDDYDDDSDDDGDKDNDSSCIESLQVFCCSANEYQKLKHPSSSDGPPQVFSVLNDTEIPLLRDQTHTITNEGKRPDVEIMVENLGQFVFDHKLQKYVAEDIPVASSAQEETKESVEELTNSWEAKYGPIIDCFSNHITNGFTVIKRKLEEGAKNAEKAACITCLSWGSKQPISPGKSSTSKTSRKSSNLPFATYKATVGRYGAYSSKTQGSINFNEDLTDPVYKSLTSIWDKVFSDLINKALPKLIQQFHAVTDMFTLCVKLTEFGVSEEKRDTIQSQILQRLINRLNNMVTELKKIIINRQREISRLFTPCVQELLTPTYNECQQEHGHGAFQRMKSRLEGAIIEGKHQIFGEAVDTVMIELSALRDQTVEYVKTECKNIIDDLKGILEPLWEEPDRQERPQYSELRTAILTACSHVCELYSLAGITKKERIPELSPAIYSSQSEDEETPGPSQHSEQSAQNRNPPDLSPAFSVLRPQERVAPNSTQSKLDDSESDETVIPSTFPSAIPKKRTLTKSWSSQYQTQTESTSQKRQASRMNETNLFDFSADEEAGPSRTILTSLKTLSQRKRSPLTENQPMKSNLRSFRDDSSLSRSKTTESDFQKIPMSEQQQIAMLRQMSNTSSKGDNSDTEDSNEEIENREIVPSKKVKTRGRPKKRDQRKEDDRLSLLREISKHKEHISTFQHISPIENDNSNESLPDLNEAIQTKGRKRKIDANSPVLPKAKRRTYIRKCNKSNSMEEGIKSLCKNLVMRRHTQNEHDSSRSACSENRGRNCLDEIDSEKDVSGNDRTKQVKHGINIVPYKHEARLNTSSTAKTRRVDEETKRNLSAENSICKDTVSESILDCIRREKTSEQVKSKSSKLNDLGLKTRSFISREKEKIGTEHHNHTETKCKRKGRKVSIENVLARKLPSSSKIEDPQPNIPPHSQPRIKKELEDDVRPTPGPRWPPHSDQDVIDLTEDSD